MTSSRRNTALDVNLVYDCDANYPGRLKYLGEFAPPRLFCRGNLDLLNPNRSIAIIGARDSTEYGDSVAQLFATDLARRGITIVSGLARGIDGIAHESALEARGTTVAVLGCGIDVDYPPRNARLQARIAQEGLLISEFTPGTPAFPRNFPQRNRIIAMLPNAVLVVEAELKSGTQSTVRWALDHGQTVFAIPGPIGRRESAGTNELIRDGGHIALSPRDILEAMQWSDAQLPDCDDASPAIADHSARAVYAALDLTGRHVDEIARRCRQSAAETLLRLLHLELDGQVRQHPGKRFSRIP